MFAFKSTAGLVGYADEAGLRKLADNPNVAAVGLDDQARSVGKAPVAEEPPPGGTVKAAFLISTPTKSMPWASGARARPLR